MAKVTKKLGLMYSRLFMFYGKFMDLFTKFLYFGGLHASIAYGIYTKPPLLMQFWYTITNNEKELMKMQ